MTAATHRNVNGYAAVFWADSLFEYTARVRFQFKRFLLMLMMLVLPVQTFASAAILGCAFSHQGMTESMAMASEAMPACHEPEQPDTPPPKHNCKHCVACYLASALPIPSAVIVPVAPTPHCVIAHPAASFIGFIPDSPDRPPRTSLA